MRLLDRTRPYGLVYPSGCFEQDGLTFDPQGAEIQRTIPVGELGVPQDAAPLVSPTGAVAKIAAKAPWFSLKHFSRKAGGPVDTKDNVLSFLRNKGLLDE